MNSIKKVMPVNRFLLSLALLVSLCCAGSGDAVAQVPGTGPMVPPTAPYLPNIPQVDPKGIVCDGVTDNQAVIQAAITKLEATSPPGGIVNLPACNNLLINSGLLINASNIFLQGAGSSGLAPPSSGGSYYIGQATAATVLVAGTGLSGGTMVTFDPAASTSGIRGGGMDGIVLAGNNNAAYGRKILSTQNGRFTRVVVENVTTIAFYMGVTANTLTGSAILDPQQNYFNNEFASLDGASTTTASCMQWSGGTNADTSFNVWDNFRCYKNNGEGIICDQADSNYVSSYFGHTTGNSPNYDIEFLANASRPACRNNKIGFVNYNGASLGIIGRTMVAGVLAPAADQSFSNVISFFDTTNGSAKLPTMEQNGTETPALYYTTDSGITNVSLGTAENRIINGDFAIDQRQNAVALTPATDGKYVTDRWIFREVGIASALTFQQSATHPIANTTTSQSIKVAVQTTPTGSNYVSECQRIEGTDLRDLGWGAASAKSIVVSFWDNEPASGTYSIYLTNNVGNRWLVHSYQIFAAAAWQYVSFVIPGDTSGTWLTTTGHIGLQACKDLGAGATLQTGTLDTWGATEFHENTGDVQLVAQTNNSAVNWTKVRIRVGTLDIPWVRPPYDYDMRRAQRFFWTSIPPGTIPGNNKGVAGSICTKNPIAAGDPSVYVQFPFQMATPPTITTFNPSAGNANWRDVTAAADVTVSVDPATALGPAGVQIVTSGTVTTLGDILCIHLQADGEL